MESPKTTKLSILMPAYNEERTVAEIIKRIDNVNLESLGVKKELIIVDDGSIDKTAELVNELCQKYDYIKFIQHGANKGKGAAIKTAIENAIGDIIILQDADLEYDPEDYMPCIKPILDGSAEVVYGSRRLDNRNKKSSNFSYYIGGRIINRIFNLLFSANLTDEYTCYKVFKADIIKSIKANGNKFDWEPEVTAKLIKKGVKIKEVPIRYYPRSTKEGKKIRWKDGVSAVWTMLKYKIIN